MDNTKRMSLRKTRETAKRIASDLDATIEVEQTGSIMTIHVDAPDGQQWADGGVSSFRIEARPTTGDDRTDLWQDAINRMNAGLIEAES